MFERLVNIFFISLCVVWFTSTIGVVTGVLFIGDNNVGDLVFDVSYKVWSLITVFVIFGNLTTEVIWKILIR